MSETNGDFTVPPSSDPLVPRDFNEWTLNAYGVAKRSGRRILGIVLLASILPTIGTIAQSYLLMPAYERLNRLVPAGQDPGRVPVDDVLDAFGQLLAFSGISIVGSLVLAYFTAAGWAAALRVAVTDAAEKPISLTEALRYGARKGLAMWGWYTLIAVCVLVGLCLCVLPGLYLVVVFALFAPVVVCEGGAAMARSLRLVHRSFGRTLGRICLVLVAVLAVGFAVFFIQNLLVEAGLGTAGLVPGSPLDLVVDGAISLVSTLITSVILISGLLITYVEARAAEGGPANTVELLRQSPA